MKKSKTRLVVINEGKILVIKTKKISDRYTFIGGSIGQNETPEEALQREAFEEAGLVLKKKKLHLVFTYCTFPNDLRTCNYFFTTSQTHLIPGLKEDHKFSDVGWVEIDKALPYLKPRDRAIVTRLISKSQFLKTA